MKPDLKELETRIIELAQVDGASREILPTFGFSDQSGRPHLEADWSERRKQELIRILEKHPFIDR